MRPATALSPDGPQNLADAVSTARAAGAQGVLVALAGRVHAGADLRKLHGYRLDAFSSGDAGVLAVLEDGALRSFRPWPDAPLHAAAAKLKDVTQWPQVEIVTSHAGAQGRTLDALGASGARGVVIAGTGNGSVHAELLAAARRAQATGVRVWRSSRCVQGGVVGTPADALPSAGALTPVQARIELMLDLMAA
jgi:L-asparaginase